MLHLFVSGRTYTEHIYLLVITKFVQVEGKTMALAIAHETVTCAKYGECGRYNTTTILLGAWFTGWTDLGVVGQIHVVARKN